VLSEIVASAEELKTRLAEADAMHDEAALGRFLADRVRPAMDKAREAADRLENLADDELWNLPKYREMLFVR
jgi:glutamine synthetase